MSRIAWAYVAGGAGEGRTMRNNREAFEQWRIVPRMLHGVTERDLSISIVGTQMSSPLLLAPIGAASVVAPDSDLIIARGAAAAGTPYVISSQGCNPMEETAAAMGSTPFWYQLYWSTDEALVDSMISRAESCGARGARDHPGHHNLGLAAAGPQPRLAAVYARSRYRPIHL
jgi:isopentenyl diphosphate isomerase/L-lactate dehydrogenase-like FMN-dependent dehydrogenase